MSCVELECFKLSYLCFFKRSISQLENSRGFGRYIVGVFICVHFMVFLFLALDPLFLCGLLFGLNKLRIT